MRQKEKSGSEFNISFYISLILISLSSLIRSQNLGTRCLKSQDNKTQDKVIGHMPFIPTNPQPIIHILKLTRQQVLILSTALISPNGCLKIPLTGRKYLSYLVLPQSICGLQSLAFPWLLIQPLSQLNLFTLPVVFVYSTVFSQFLGIILFVLFLQQLRKPY